LGTFFFCNWVEQGERDEEKRKGKEKGMVERRER